MHDDLTPLARGVGAYLAEQCTEGMPKPFGDDLLAAFPQEDRKSLRLALAELEAEGLVTLRHLVGQHLPRVRPTVELFVAADPGITGHDPIEDSVIIARMLIEKPKRGSARDLEAETGWERRRFNPAFALVIPYIAPGRVRQAIQPDYPTLGVLIADEDIIQLRKYIQRNTR